MDFEGKVLDTSIVTTHSWRPNCLPSRKRSSSSAVALDLRFKGALRRSDVNSKIFSKSSVDFPFLYLLEKQCRFFRVLTIVSYEVTSHTLMKKDSLAFRFIYRMYNSNCFGPWYTRRQLNRVHEKRPNGHSSSATFTYGDITIKAVPQNSDNYSYVVVCDSTNDCVVIDVGDARPILQCLYDEKRTPHAVLVTHKHWYPFNVFVIRDHCYGNKELKKRFKNLDIYGGEIDRPSDVNMYIRNETLIHIGRLHFKAFHVPGHTAGHMIYALQLNDELKCLFTGDFLFIAGIGKIFEGSTSQMISSLLMLNHFSPDTIIFPGHEYAKLNLSFALSLEKDNEVLKAMSKTVQEKRNTRSPIVGITLGDEYKINPYLRTCSLKFRKALVAAGYNVPAEGKVVGGRDVDEVKDSSMEAQVAVFDALEKAKNNFIEELMKQMEQKSH
uniref:Metallo-beta-lactamase domain-containing protein n=1 Tax=Setaria digitata TaxID=48799 RepID=A0A915PF51_9BILA